MTGRTESQGLAPLQVELRDVMATWGCPLCRLADKAERTFIESLNYERVLDLKTRDHLKASRGLCRRHGEMWRQVQGSALGIAIVYRISVLDLLRDSAGAAEKVSSGGLLRRRDRAADLAQALSAAEPCPACVVGEQTLSRYGAVLLRDVPDPALQRHLVACGGLCLPHLRDVLGMRGANRVLEPLLACHREAWEQLMGELEEYIRKNDYRFTGEPISTAEGRSWTRALALLTGLVPREGASEIDRRET